MCANHKAVRCGASVSIAVDSCRLAWLWAPPVGNCQWPVRRRYRRLPKKIVQMFFFRKQKLNSMFYTQRPLLWCCLWAPKARATFYWLVFCRRKQCGDMFLNFSEWEWDFPPAFVVGLAKPLLLQLTSTVLLTRKSLRTKFWLSNKTGQWFCRQLWKIVLTFWYFLVQSIDGTRR